MRPSKGRWFQREDCRYLRVMYGRHDLYLCFQLESALRQWMELLKLSVGYVKYVQGKLDIYYANEQSQKASNRIVQQMMERCNEEIVIVDQNTFSQ